LLVIEGIFEDINNDYDIEVTVEATYEIDELTLGKWLFVTSQSVFNIIYFRIVKDTI